MTSHAADSVPSDGRPGGRGGGGRLGRQHRQAYSTAAPGGVTDPSLLALIRGNIELGLDRFWNQLNAAQLPVIQELQHTVHDVRRNCGELWENVEALAGYVYGTLGRAFEAETGAVGSGSSAPTTALDADAVRSIAREVMLEDATRLVGEARVLLDNARRMRDEAEEVMGGDSQESSLPSEDTAKSAADTAPPENVELQFARIAERVDELERSAQEVSLVARQHTDAVECDVAKQVNMVARSVDSLVARVEGLEFSICQSGEVASSIENLRRDFSERVTKIQVGPEFVHVPMPWKQAVRVVKTNPVDATGRGASTRSCRRSMGSVCPTAAAPATPGSPKPFRRFKSRCAASATA